MHKRARAATENDPRLALGSEAHINAKDWIIQSPDGKIYECRNLMQWCREHEDLFDGTYKQAHSGLVVVKRSMLGLRKRNPTTHWKGWTVIIK